MGKKGSINESNYVALWKEIPTRRSEEEIREDLDYHVTIKVNRKLRKEEREKLLIALAKAVKEAFPEIGKGAIEIFSV